MSHVLQTVQTSKTVPRSQYQRSTCTVYPQRSGLAYHTSNNPGRHVKSRRGVRTVDQTLRQDDRNLDATTARRRCSIQSPRTRSPGDSSGRKRLRHISGPKVMSNPSLNLGSRADDGVHQAVLPVSEFIAIKEYFLSLFSRCSELLCVSISCALSCVLRSFRPLRKVEIAGAVILYLTSKSVSTAEFVCEQDLSAGWFDECRGILAEDENGHVHFAQSSFRLFFSSYQIHGIDPTHATMSIICLMEIEIQVSQRVQQSTQGACTRVQQLAMAAFSEYAAAFWVRHYQAVQNTRADLARIVHRVLNIQSNQNAETVAKQNVVPAYADASDEMMEFCVENDLYVLAELYQQGKRKYSHPPVIHQHVRPLSVSDTTTVHVKPSKVMLDSGSASDMESTNEAFEQLDMTDGVDTASSSECEDWTKLRMRRH